MNRFSYLIVNFPYRADDMSSIFLWTDEENEFVVQITLRDEATQQKQF